MKENNFESFIKSSVEQFNEAPAEHVWGGVKNKLTENMPVKKGRFSAAKIIGGIVIAALITAALLFVFNSRDASNKNPEPTKNEATVHHASLNNDGSELVNELFSNELELVKIAGKGLMVYVCMDECVHCARFIKETLSEPEVDGYLEKHFFQTTIDLTDKKYRNFLKKYEVQAAPSSLFFAADGTFLSKRIGRVSKNIFMKIMAEAWKKVEEIEKYGYLKDDKKIIEKEITPALKIYPNPNNGKFTVQVSAEKEPLRIRIVDRNGREIFNENIVDFNGFLKKEIDITGSVKGMYILQVLYGKAMYSEKIFVQ